MVSRNNDEISLLFELNRKWRRVDGRAVTGNFMASNLSLTIIFPEDTIVNGTLAIHIFESDIWIYEMMIYIFAVLVVGFIFGMVMMLLVIACIRWYLLRVGRDVPDCLKKYIKPINHDYKFFLKNKSIVEKKFSSNQVLYSQDTCAICYDLYADGEATAVLNCHHVFHCGCVSEWVNKKTEKSQLCPLCNYPIQKPRKPAPQESELTAIRAYRDDEIDSTVKQPNIINNIGLQSPDIGTDETIADLNDDEN